MEKILAVVVTYNRRELLSQCIHALKEQTRKIDRILVINNGSTDDTEEWLRNQKDLSFITQKNVGGAGGFYTGIKTGYEKKYSWIWLMDDDGYPRADALENLLEGDPEELCLRNCAVVNIQDRKSFVWKTGKFKTIDEVTEPVIRNVAHPFNGTLLHRRIIERVGYPNPKLFLWGDETEYFYRIILKNRIPSYTKANSIHYHPPTAYSFKKDWNFSNNWKMYYYIRNRFSILQSRFSSSKVAATFMYLVFVTAFAGTILVYQKTHKFQKMVFILWPMRDAFKHNFEATPTSIIQRLSKIKQYAQSASVSHQLRAVKAFLMGSPSHMVQSADKI
ncbi:MAG: glycosyltransferase family 2 protein [Bacteroidota bacterium]|nr:glycosyltransferase family 2 protein [Bacteroidota bacterium]